MDQGEHGFTFTILTGTVAELKETVDIKAQIANEQPVAVSAFCGGYEKQPVPTFTVEGVRLDTCKLAKDGVGYILRLFNYHDTPATARLVLESLGLEATVGFAAQELKTLYVTQGRWCEADLLTETPLD